MVEESSSLNGLRNFLILSTKRDEAKIKFNEMHRKYKDRNFVYKMICGLFNFND